MKKPEIRSDFDQPVAPQYAPQATMNQPSGSNMPWGKILTIVGVVGAIILVSALWYLPTRYFKAQKESYKPEFLAPIEVKHEVIGETKDSPIPTAETLISPKIKQELNSGKGLEVNLVSTYKGKEDGTQKFVFEPWKTYEETSPSARQKSVNAKIVELQSKLNELGKYAPREWNFVVILDDTEGVDAKLRQKFQTVYDDLLLDERVGQGDGVTLHFAKLSDSQLSQEAPQVVIPKGTGSIDAYQEQLTKAREWLLQSKTSSASSSVYPGLFNILSDYVKQDRTRVVIISDMMENDVAGSGVTFYEVKGGKTEQGKTLLMDSAQWEQLDSLILAKQKPIDLKGLWIKIYAPPSVAKISTVAKEAQNYSEHLLKKLNAEVETKF